ncbi:MAG TPA: hypothetical protein PLA68_03705 [Panacibacter sp.]|nr:hypothetical protein [Panacibacter sp.]
MHAYYKVTYTIIKPFIFSVYFFFHFYPVFAQQPVWQDASLNTAEKAVYMKAEEKEMICEINRLRSNPARYAKLFIAPLIKDARETFETDGKGYRNYSITTSFYNDTQKHDTTYFYANEEELKAVESLYDTLLKLKPLSVLLPDEGIYNACIKHGKDQAPTGNISHQGTDGSWPWDRIKKFSSSMQDGNENIAMDAVFVINVRNIVLLLLIDSGIGGYGHRYNLLDKNWTHVACYVIPKELISGNWWIQDFGIKGKK